MLANVARISTIDDLNFSSTRVVDFRRNVCIIFMFIIYSAGFHHLLLNYIYIYRKKNGQFFFLTQVSRKKPYICIAIYSYGAYCLI